MESGELRLLTLLAHRSVLRLAEEDLLHDAELAAADPALSSLTNVNDQQDYARALRASTG